MTRRSLFAVLLGITTATPACAVITGASDLYVGDPSIDATAETAQPADARAPDDVGASEAPETGPDGGDPSLIGYWSFDETSGASAADQSGKGRGAELVGDAAFAPAAGVRGGALFLDGAGHASVASLDGASFPKTGTLSVWFKYAFAQTDLEQRGVFDLYDQARAHVFIRRANGAPADEFQVAYQVPSDGDYAWANNFPAVRNEWIHVVVAWNAIEGMGALYIDGVLVERTSYQAQYADFAPTAQEFRLGMGFIGLIDEVRLYDRELSPGEATALP